MRLGSTSLARMLSDTSIGEDDRALLGRQRDDRGGARDGEDAGVTAREQQRGCQVAAQPLARTDRPRTSADVRIAHRVLLAPPQHEHVQPDQDRDDEQQPQRERREERHGR